MSTTDNFEERPWGRFTVLEEGDKYQVKRVEIGPGKRLSYQKHTRRSEHWFVVHGTAKVTLNGLEVLVPCGSSIDIGTGDAHRIANASSEWDMIFIEIQTGDYFGEDDIERLEDDFGRS